MSREDLHYDLREKLGENFHATSHKLLSLGNSFQSNRKIDSDVLRCIENPQAAGQIGLLYQWINRQRFSRSQKRHKPAKQYETKNLQRTCQDSLHSSR